MADFYQTGMISTFHRFGNVDVGRMENELIEFNRHNPIALVLPCAASDLEAPAINKIIEGIKEIPYLNEVVVTMGRTKKEHFEKAKIIFKQLPQRTRVIWNTGPQIGKLYKQLEQNKLYIGQDGKGRSCWTAYGYILARESSKIIALHDCDIVNYSRELLGKLCYPVVST